MSTMRAKLRVGFVHENFYPETVKTSETLKFHAVPAPKYDPDGLDEDNTFAKFSPSADLSINIMNPELFGKFKAGDTFYVDFTPAP